MRSTQLWPPWILLLAFACAGEQHPEVAVIMNALSPVSQSIGEAYADARGIPNENLIRLPIPIDNPLLSDARHETISRDRFEEEIQKPLEAWLADRSEEILILVTTKGIPLRIQGSRPPPERLLKEATGASVDAELALIGSSQIGSPGITSSTNPWFADPRDFRRFREQEPDSPLQFLVARLTGYSDEPPSSGVPQDVAKLIEAAQAPMATEGLWLVDQDPSLPPAMEAANEILLAPTAAHLTSLGMKVHADEQPTFASDFEAIQGYASWGSNDNHEAHPRTYGRIKGHVYPGHFVSRAIAADLVSTNARTFTRDSKYSQSMIADLITQGVGGVAGHVAEPTLPAVVRPHLMLRDYALGKTAIEAYYQALPYLGWMNVYVGDPLMRLEIETTNSMPVDLDGDGVLNEQDNCLSIPNPKQRDSNADGLGNICDADVNNDGAVTTSWGQSFPRQDRGDIEAIALSLQRGDYDSDHDLDGNGSVDERDLSIAQLYLLLPTGAERKMRAR